MVADTIIPTPEKWICVSISAKDEVAFIQVVGIPTWRYIFKRRTCNYIFMTLKPSQWKHIRGLLYRSSKNIKTAIDPLSHDEYPHKALLDEKEEWRKHVPLAVR